MNIQRVKQGARITWINGIYMIIIGIYTMVFASFNMRISFRNISELWGFFLRYDAAIAHLFVLFNVLVGILVISNGIFTIYLSDFILKRKEKMTWVVLLVGGIISWAGMLTISILFKNWILTGMAGVGWVIFIIGMILPLNYYLEKPYREY